MFDFFSQTIDLFRQHSNLVTQNVDFFTQDLDAVIQNSNMFIFPDSAYFSSV